MSLKSLYNILHLFCSILCMKGLCLVNSMHSRLGDHSLWNIGSYTGQQVGGWGRGWDMVCSLCLSGKRMCLYVCSIVLLPKHIHKGIAIGVMTRVVQNTTSQVLMKMYKRKLIKRFKQGGYNKHIRRKLWMMDHKDREEMLLPKETNSNGRDALYYAWNLLNTAPLYTEY